MTFEEFHNGLRAMLNIDLPDLEARGLFVDDPMDPIRARGFARWELFRDNPHMEFIRMPTAEAKLIWEIMEERRLEYAAEREERATAALAAAFERSEQIRRDKKP